MASIVEVSALNSMGAPAVNRQLASISLKDSLLRPGVGSLIGHAGGKPPIWFDQSLRQFDQSGREGGMIVVVLVIVVKALVIVVAHTQASKTSDCKSNKNHLFFI